MADAWARLRAAADDRHSGAAEIATAAGRALADLTVGDVHQAIDLLLRGHPTMAPMWRLAAEILDGPSPATGAARFLALLARDRSAAVVLAAALPEDLVTISWSSSVIEAIRLRGPTTVFCMRSEPGGEGERLAEAIGRAAMVIEDDEAIENVPGRAVVVGADALTPAAVVNKVKTRALAEAAIGRGIPVYVVAGETKVVARDLPVAPRFEPTPLELFTAVATPSGLLPPEEAATLARSHDIHPNLLPLLEELSGGG